jgi:hypothetical protein
MLRTGRYRVFYVHDGGSSDVRVLAVLRHGSDLDADQAFSQVQGSLGEAGLAADAHECAGTEAVQPPESKSGDTDGDSSSSLSPRIDVFLSYAADDTGKYARELADALTERGVSVWLDQYELRLGDSIPERIDDALARSRFVVVILSPTFFNQRWSQHELDLALQREHDGEHNILPIWYGVSRLQVADQAQPLADRVALDALSESVESVADQIAAVAARAG